MRKKKVDELNDKDRIYIKTIYSDTDMSWDEKMSVLCLRFKKSQRTIQRYVKALGYSKYEEIENEEIRQSKLRQYDKKSKYFIFTSAQNATPVHPKLWENIRLYAEFLGAEIGVIPLRYKNPNSLWTMNMERNEWWDEGLTEYLDGARHVLHNYLEILADIKTVPTATDPLNGYEGVSGYRSCIIGHPRVHMKVIPALEGHPKKIMMTTGSCTIKNYTDTKAGKKAEFHHTYGFVVVEIKDEFIHYMRQVTAKSDGSFCDLIYEVNGEVKRIDSCEAFVAGDIHVSQLYRPVMDKTIEFFKYLKPKHIVLHDIMNGKSISHHDAKDPIKQYEKYKTGANLLAREEEELYELFDEYNLLEYHPLVVHSNHDLWLDRWVRDADWKKDIPNAEKYMEYTLASLRGDASKGLLPYLLNKRFGDSVIALGFDESFVIHGWELGQHGHMGANGSFGTVNGYRKLNTKLIIGDKHTPERKDNVVVVGTYSVLRMGFNEGASSWMWCGAILHNNKKVQQIIFAEDNNFTTLLDGKANLAKNNGKLQAFTA